MNTNTNVITPLIPATTLTSLALINNESNPTAELLNTILTAFHKKVDSLALLSGEELKETVTGLFCGNRPFGPNVIGVSDQPGVEKLFKRVIGYNKPSIIKDLNGNNIYTFKLPHPYTEKGRTNCVLVREVAENNRGDREALGVGLDWDAEDGVYHSKIQIPCKGYLKTDVITIMLSPDKLEFIAWFGGEPEKIFTEKNWRELVDKNGRVILDNIPVRVGRDYTNPSNGYHNPKRNYPKQHDFKHIKRSASNPVNFIKELESLQNHKMPTHNPIKEVINTVSQAFDDAIARKS